VAGLKIRRDLIAGLDLRQVLEGFDLDSEPLALQILSPVATAASGG
jgi:hypothetical protein